MTSSSLPAWPTASLSGGIGPSAPSPRTSATSTTSTRATACRSSPASPRAWRRFPASAGRRFVPALNALISQLRDAVETHAWTEDDLLFPVLVAHEHPSVLDDDGLARGPEAPGRYAGVRAHSHPADHQRARRADRRLQDAGGRSRGARRSRAPDEGAHRVADRGARPRGSLPAAARERDRRRARLSRHGDGRYCGPRRTRRNPRDRHGVTTRQWQRSFSPHRAHLLYRRQNRLPHLVVHRHAEAAVLFANPEDGLAGIARGRTVGGGHGRVQVVDHGRHQLRNGVGPSRAADVDHQEHLRQARLFLLLPDLVRRLAA